MIGTLSNFVSMILFAVFFGLSLLPAQASSPAGATSSPNSVVLVELFTSEGCSSCPPADSLLRQINGARTRTGQWIVGISEHVTYWNDLGWVDPYSSEIYTARQYSYGNRFRLDSVYTPQMVINGTEEIVGSDSDGLQRALQKENSQPKVPLHILSATIAGGVLNVSFSMGAAADGQQVDIMAVLTDDSDRSNVGRGENSGRTLDHVSVARSLTRVATVLSATQKTVQVPLPASFASGRGGHHLILFAQTPGFGPVLGTDSKPI